MPTEMKTVICPGPPEHEFEIPKGRGRPPKFCPEHKPNGKSEGEKVSDETKTRSRPRPGGSKNGDEPTPSPTRARPRAPRVEHQEKGPLDEPTPDPGLSRIPPPRGDKGSRGKSDNAADRAANASETEAVPLGTNGKPMARIDFSASELIPTGQYANVTIGPVRITAYIDLGRNGENGYFTTEEKDILVQAANELAEMAERDVIGVQRNLVLESLQSDQ